MSGKKVVDGGSSSDGSGVQVQDLEAGRPGKRESTQLIPSGMPGVGSGAQGLDQAHVSNKPPSVRVLSDGGGSGPASAAALEIYKQLQAQPKQ